MSSRLALVFALSALAACGATSVGPADAIAAYAQALRDGRYTDAYRLLSVEARRVISPEQFSELVRTRPDEVADTVRWLEQVDSNAPVTARLELASGENLTLVEEHGQWRLDPSALDFYGQRTPRQALRSFVRALRYRRYDVLMHFVPQHLAAGLTEESLRAAWEGTRRAEDINSLIETLTLALDRPIEVVGDHATMQYGMGGRYIAQLVREEGIWKVEDPQ